MRYLSRQANDFNFLLVDALNKLARFFFIGIANFIVNYIFYLFLLLIFTHTVAYALTILSVLTIILYGNIVKVFNRKISFYNAMLYLTYYGFYSLLCFYLFEFFIDIGAKRTLAPLFVQCIVFLPNFILSRSIINFASKSESIK